MNPPSLDEIRVLVVEDELMIALALKRALADAGCAVIGPVPRIARALECATEVPLDAALLDINVGGERVFPVAELLQARAVPFAFLSGYQESVLPERFRACPMLAKPCSAQDVIAVLRRILRIGGRLEVEGER